MQQKEALPTCHAEMIDAFEQATVDYMAGKRHLSEEQMRHVLVNDKPTCESYNRKVARLVHAAHAKGFTPAKFASAALYERQTGWARSADAGPQRPLGD